MGDKWDYDLYYLDKQDSDQTSDWKYYRVRPVYQMHIETCEVEFPALTDKGPATQHPFIVGLASAHDIKEQHMKTLGINQECAVLIGLVPRRP